MDEPKRIVSTSPHIHDRLSTAAIMWRVSAALTPAALWGVYVFGLRALAVLVISIVSAVASEYLLGRISGEYTIWDGSAFLTGLLIGMNMSADVALFVPVIAAVFAIGIAKWVFGGLGANWINPALAGRVFVFFSFPAFMNTYRMPRTVQSIDALGSATPLTTIKMAVTEGSADGLSCAQILSNTLYPASDFAVRVSDWFSTHLHIDLSRYTVDAFFGNIGGCIGEVSALLLLCGALYLLFKKIIRWEIPVSFLLTFSLLSWAFGGLRVHLGLFHGDVLLPLFSGGMILGAFFMATDMVTSPVTAKGMLLFGTGIGIFTFLIRSYGSLPEAVSLAIILMNIFVPTIDRYILPKPFGESVQEEKG